MAVTMYQRTLGLRAQIGLARVVALFDMPGARDLAMSALWDFAHYYAKDTDGGDVPVAFFESDPPLWSFYQDVVGAKRQQENLQEQIVALAAAHIERSRSLQASEREMRAALSAQLASAKEMLKQLHNGEMLEINGHTLEWDEDMGSLAGTNCYGVDYYAGDLNLLSVSVWRCAMVKGQVWGDSPPGGNLSLSEMAEAEYTHERSLLVEQIEKITIRLRECLFINADLSVLQSTHPLMQERIWESVPLDHLDHRIDHALPKGEVSSFTRQESQRFSQTFSSSEVAT